MNVDKALNGVFSFTMLQFLISFLGILVFFWAGKSLTEVKHVKILSFPHPCLRPSMNTQSKAPNVQTLSYFWLTFYFCSIKILASCSDLKDFLISEQLTLRLQTPASHLQHSRNKARLASVILTKEIMKILNLCLILRSIS